MRRRLFWVVPVVALLCACRESAVPTAPATSLPAESGGGVAAQAVPEAVFRTTPADKDGDIAAQAPLTVEFNLCRSRPKDEDDDLKFTYDWNDDGEVDYFGHCRQSLTLEEPTTQQVRVCVTDRRPGNEVCQSYTVRALAEPPQTTPTPAVVPGATPTPTPMPTGTPTPMATPTPTGTVTPGPTMTPTMIPTSTPTSTPTATPTQTPVPTSAPDIHVAGNGLEILHGDTTPDTADFTDLGTANQNATRPSATFTVSNVGSAALDVTGVSLPTGFDLGGLGIILHNISAGGSAILVIRCDTGAAGTFTGNVQIHSNDPDEPAYSFAVSCVVRPLIPDVEVTGNGVVIALGDNTPDTSDSTDFGSTTVGGILRRDFRIHNRGNADLTVTSVSVSGGFLFAFPGPSGISVGDRLAPLRSGTIRLECPSAAAGTYSGTVTVGTDDPDENPYDFTITCQVN